MQRLRADVAFGDLAPARRLNCAAEFLARGGVFLWRDHCGLARAVTRAAQLPPRPLRPASASPSPCFDRDRDLAMASIRIAAPASPLANGLGRLTITHRRPAWANALILPERLLRCCAGGTPGVAKGREITPAGAAPAMTASARLPNHLQRGWLAKLQPCLGLDSKKMPRPPKRTGLELNRARPLKSPVSPSAPTRNVAFGSAPEMQQNCLDRGGLVAGQ